MTDTTTTHEPTKAEAFAARARSELRWPNDMQVSRETAHQGIAIQSLLISMLGLPDDADLAGLSLLIALDDETAVDSVRTLLDGAADSFTAQLREITRRRTA